MQEDFIKILEKSLKEAEAAIDSAFMSDDFVQGVDQSLGDIRNITVDHTGTEKHADKTDTS